MPTSSFSILSFSRISSSPTMAGISGLSGLSSSTSPKRDDSQTLTNSHAKQLVAEQQFKDLEAERFVNTVEQQTELVLTTESGIANLKVSKHSDSWNKWLTRSEAEFGLEYKAKVSIKTQQEGAGRNRQCRIGRCDNIQQSP